MYILIREASSAGNRHSTTLHGELSLENYFGVLMLIHTLMSVTLFEECLKIVVKCL